MLIPPLSPGCKLTEAVLRPAATDGQLNQYVGALSGQEYHYRPIWFNAELSIVRKLLMA